MKFLNTLALMLLLARPVMAQPQITPSTVQTVNSPNTLTWPVTTTIQKFVVADNGIQVTFDKCNQWPDVTPPGWAGPLRFTLHLFLNIGGQWYESGIIQFWACDQFNGGPIYQDNQIARNWVYDNRWGPMVNHQSAPGERIGFMVSAGNARGEDDHLVAERSDIIEISMPTNATTYPPFLAYEGQGTPAPVPVPPPTPVPVPVPVPVPMPPSPVPTDPNYTALLQQIVNLQQQILGIEQNTNTQVTAMNKTLAQTLGQAAAFVSKYVLPAVTAYLAGKKL
jgi:hypothetical protein